VIEFYTFFNTETETETEDINAVEMKKKEAF